MVWSQYLVRPFLPLGSGFGLVILIALIWELIWKGLGLWRAARAGSTGWFVAIMIFNTLGILPILYLYVFSKPAEPVSK